VQIVYIQRLHGPDKTSFPHNTCYTEARPDITQVVAKSVSLQICTHSLFSSPLVFILVYVLILQAIGVVLTPLALAIVLIPLPLAIVLVLLATSIVLIPLAPAIILIPLVLLVLILL
jgi:hypothetical protein